MEELEFTALIEEYKICREEASRLESLIWKTSTIFGLSSGAGLLLKMKSEFCSAEHFYTTCAIAVLMITASLVWWRLSRRWWSIQQVKYKRMKVLESKLGFKQNSLVSCTDYEKMAYIKYQQMRWQRFEDYIWYDIPKCIKEKLFSRKKANNGNLFTKKQIQNISNHEYRGNQPVIRFLIIINIIIWLCMIIVAGWPLYLEHENQSLFSLVLIVPISIFLILYFKFFSKP